MIDWKREYDNLIPLVSELLTKSKDLRFLEDRIVQQMNWIEYSSLREQKKTRYFRLTQETEVTPRYDADGSYTKKPRKYPAGTLVSGKTVYLDHEGDGFLDFPPDLLEEVILSDDEVNYDLVVSDG